MKAGLGLISLATLIAMVVFAGTGKNASAASAGNEDKASLDAFAQKGPRLVLIIRHAEKPPAEAASPNLSERGKERAGVIPRLFQGTSETRFPRPEALFATHATKKSNRPYETIVPLSKVLGLTIDDRYGRGDLAALAVELSSGKYAGKVVLISWHHAEMKELAQVLGVPEAPEWPDTLFDRIWKIDWQGGKAHLVSLPQQLLPGDAAE